MKEFRSFVAQMTMSIALVVFTTSCASIINGGSQMVSLRSMPDGAKVTVLDWRGQAVGGGSTPTTMMLKRGAGFFTSAKYRVRFEKDGYVMREVPITGKISGWYVGNFVFGGLIGWLIVDPATGGMWTLAPEDVHAELAPQQGSVWHDNSGFTVVLREQVPVEYVNRMKPVALD
ncbi:MAG: hypothetical protein ACOX5G_02805 [Kiritimatiellia bacterium]